MPNWVYNKLYITGHEKAREAFRKQARGTYKDSKGKVCKANFMFSQFCPPPPLPLLQGIYKVKPKNDDWPLDMKWKLAAWGCKWDVEDASSLLRITKSSTVYGMSTAWSPPTEFVRRVSCLYPYLHFSLHSWYPAGGRGVEKFVQGHSNTTRSMYEFYFKKVGSLP